MLFPSPPLAVFILFLILHCSPFPIKVLHVVREVLLPTFPPPMQLPHPNSLLDASAPVPPPATPGDLILGDAAQAVAPMVIPPVQGGASAQLDTPFHLISARSVAIPHIYYSSTMILCEIIVSVPHAIMRIWRFLKKSGVYLRHQSPLQSAALFLGRDMYHFPLQSRQLMEM